MSVQPNQCQVQCVFADGVLTITGDLWVNPTVATSVADEASATTTVTAPNSGQIHWVTVITPNTPVTTEDETVYGNIRNASSPNA